MGPSKRTPEEAALRRDSEMENAIRKALNELIAFSKRSPRERAELLDSASAILAEAIFVHLHSTRDEPPCPAAPPSPPPFEPLLDPIASDSRNQELTPSKKRRVRESTTPAFSVRNPATPSSLRAQGEYTMHEPVRPSRASEKSARPRQGGRSTLRRAPSSSRAIRRTSRSDAGAAGSSKRSETSGEMGRTPVGKLSGPTKPQRRVLGPPSGDSRLIEKSRKEAGGRRKERTLQRKSQNIKENQNPSALKDSRDRPNEETRSRLPGAVEQRRESSTDSEKLPIAGEVATENQLKNSGISNRDHVRHDRADRDQDRNRSETLTAFADTEAPNGVGGYAKRFEESDQSEGSDRWEVPEIPQGSKWPDGPSYSNNLIDKDPSSEAKKSGMPVQGGQSKLSSEHHPSKNMESETFAAETGNMRVLFRARSPSSEGQASSLKRQDQMPAVPLPIVTPDWQAISGVVRASAQSLASPRELSSSRAPHEVSHPCGGLESVEFALEPRKMEATCPSLTAHVVSGSRSRDLRSRPGRHGSGRVAKTADAQDVSKYVTVPAKKRKHFNVSSTFSPKSASATSDDDLAEQDTQAVGRHKEIARSPLDEELRDDLVDKPKSKSSYRDPPIGEDTITDEETFQNVPWWQQAANRNENSKSSSPGASDLVTSSLFPEFISALTFACVTDKYASSRLLDNHLVDSGSVGGGVYSVIANVLGMLDRARNTEYCTSIWPPQILKVLQERPNLRWAPIEYDPSFVQFAGCEVCMRHCLATRYLWATGEQYDPRSYWPEACVFRVSSFVELASGAAIVDVELLDERRGPETAFSDNAGGELSTTLDAECDEIEELWADMQCVWRCMLYHELTHSVARVSSSVRELIVDVLKQGHIEVPALMEDTENGKIPNPRERVENYLANVVLRNDNFMRHMTEWLEDAYRCGLKHLGNRPEGPKGSGMFLHARPGVSPMPLSSDCTELRYEVPMPCLVSSAQSVVNTEDERHDREMCTMKPLMHRSPTARGTADSVDLPDIFDSESEPEYDEHQRKFVLSVILGAQQACPVDPSQLSREKQ